MGERPEAKLTEEAKVYAVQALACFDAPGVVAKSLRTEFGLVITPQSVEAYDPTKRAGRRLAAKWRAIFETTRAEFLKDTARIGISHRSVRLRALQRVLDRAEGQGNTMVALRSLQQAAEEMGDAYTNKREISGPNGGAIIALVDRPPNETREQWVERKRLEMDG